MHTKGWNSPIDFSRNQLESTLESEKQTQLFQWLTKLTDIKFTCYLNFTQSQQRLQCCDQN